MMDQSATEEEEKTKAKTKLEHDYSQFKPNLRKSEPSQETIQKANVNHIVQIYNIDPSISESNAILDNIFIIYKGQYQIKWLSKSEAVCIFDKTDFAKQVLGQVTDARFKMQPVTTKATTNPKKEPWDEEENTKPRLFKADVRVANRLIANALKGDDNVSR